MRNSQGPRDYKQRYYQDPDLKGKGSAARRLGSGFGRRWTERYRYAATEGRD